VFVPRSYKAIKITDTKTKDSSVVLSFKRTQGTTFHPDRLSLGKIEPTILLRGIIMKDYILIPNVLLMRTFVNPR